MARIRILHVITDLDTGGAESMLARLLGEMDAKDFEQQVVSLRDRGPLTESVEAQGVHVDALEMQRPTRLPGAIFRLAGIYRRLRPDIVQGWMYHANLMATLASLLHPVRIAYGLHHGTLLRGRDKLGTIAIARLGSLLARKTLRVVSCSEAGARFHTAFGYPSEKLCVIPNGFDLEAFRPDPEARSGLRSELGVSPDSLLIGLGGRFAPTKNHRLFLEAARQLLDGPSQFPSLQFVLFGAGIDRSNSPLASWIDDLDLRSRVHLLGRRADVARIYAGLDLFTCCSLSEAFPLVVGEAMACGVPCAVSDVGDAALLVGKTGSVFASGDSEGLADAWAGLLSLGSEGRRALGTSARRRIEERFSLTYVAARYETLYRELTE